MDHDYKNLNGQGTGRGRPASLASAEPRKVIEELREINHELAQRIAKGETPKLDYDFELDVYTLPEGS